MLTTAAMLGCAVSCTGGAEKEDKYLIDEFADLKIMKYKVPGWDGLSLQQKSYVYHLSEAAKYGRDIIWDQNCEINLPVRHMLENILENYRGERDCAEFNDFLVYAKRVFFSNGIHHHYAEEKFFPACSRDYFKQIARECGEDCDALIDAVYDPSMYRWRKTDEGDIVKGSSVNFYKGVSRAEVEDFYAGMVDPDDKTPVSYGLNSRLVKGEDGVIREEVYHENGLYGAAIAKITGELELAAKFAENDSQKQYISTLIAYYRSGDLRLWDKYNIEWLRDTTGTIDFVNGFIEDYNDPLGRKATWESLVNIRDDKASQRTVKLSENAQWFEDHSPVDDRFKKPTVKGVSAKVIDAVMLAGDCYPATPIGINLPNADWIRRDYGSKSVTIANITHAYDMAAQESPNSTLKEFAYDEDEIAMAKKYLSVTDEIHTDLHECLGHGSGQLLPGTSPNALGEYSSTLEETRADLFGLYYIADDKLVELGIIPDKEAYKAMYSNYIRNGLMVQFSRVELGKKNTEAHMQNRKLIAQWCYEKGLENNVIEKKFKDGKTYFVVNDYPALRNLFGELLAEVQRIKSEGDYAAGKKLVNGYAVDIDYNLHKEVIERYSALNLKPYGGFVNPVIEPVVNNGTIVDYRLSYTDDYLGQMLEYGRTYRTL